jgi:hypothetical protein
MREILTNEVVHSFGLRFEDPLDNPFAESFHFDGEGYVVFPEVAKDGCYILRHLLEATVGTGRAISGHPLSETIRDRVSALLTLSDEVAYRLDLDRHVRASGEAYSPLVPPGTELRRLREAVTFTDDEAAELLTSVGVPIDSLDDFTLPLGSAEFDAWSVDDHALHFRPIVRDGHTLVLAAPRKVLCALRHVVLRYAQGEGLLSDLVVTYHDRVWNETVRTLRHLGHPVSRLGTFGLDEAVVSEGLFHLDLDKALYAILVTDPLGDYAPNAGSQVWEPGTMGERLAEWTESVEREIYSSEAPPNDILFLALTQGIGRTYAYHFPKGRGPVGSTVLAMEASDLEAIMLLYRNEPLRLWQFAQARSALREGRPVQAASILDELALYRRRKNSFYLGDDPAPPFVVLFPGGKGEVREEIQSMWDPHTAHGPAPGEGTEVILDWEGERLPVYYTRDAMSGAVTARGVRLVVEGLPVPVWVTTPPGDGRLLSWEITLAQVLAYWVWQLTPVLTPALEELDIESLRVRLTLADENGWDERERGERGAPPISVASDAPEGAIDVTIGSGFLDDLDRPDNSGERALMRAVLLCLREILPPERGHLLYDTVVDEALDLYAPLGIKRRAMLVDRGAILALDDRDLAPYRRVQDGPLSDALDELGSHLCAEGVGTGPIKGDDRRRVLNEAVDFFYKSLESLVATLSPIGLLEGLVALQEAVAYRGARRQLEMPTRMAFFGEGVDMTSQFIEEQFTQATIATSSRFVVEYVASRPPDGYRPFSYSVYDELQALAKHLIDHAFASDLVNYKLADIGLEMLPSGRLGMERRGWDTANAAFAPQFIGDQLDNARAVHPLLWEGNKGGDASDFESRLDVAMEAECGLSFGDLGDGLGALTRVGEPLRGVVTFKAEELQIQLAADLNWTAEKARHFVDLMSIRPREDFLKPPKPFRPEHAYPWIYNRPLSYLRRPLLLRQTSGTDADAEALWGVRHVQNAWGYLVVLGTEGRFKAESQALRKLQGRLSKERGARFEQDVADLVRSLGGVAVRTGVKKVGPHRLADGGHNLGDIDVLIAVPHRRVIVAVECKNLATARNPRELSTELDALVRGKGQSKSTVDKHLDRVDWLRTHVVDVLSWLSLPGGRAWTVEPVIVTDRHVLAPLLGESEIPIVAVSALPEWVLGT